MHEEIKNRWIENLESGEYPKGVGSLREKGRYCCLGVLTDMYIREHDDLMWMGNLAVPDKSSDYCDEYAETLLPAKVREWAGIEEEDYHIHSFGGGSLATINDHSDTFDPVIERIKEL